MESKERNALRIANPLKVVLSEHENRKLILLKSSPFPIDVIYLVLAYSYVYINIQYTVYKTYALYGHTYLV